MAGSVSDEAFARYVSQIGAAGEEQIEAAKAEQAKLAQAGQASSLSEVLVQQGVLTTVMRENLEKKLQAQGAGGIRQLGPYKLIKRIGEGGMGAVYLAEDTHVGRQVAIKVLPRKFSENEDAVARFRREAKAAGALNHANIVCAHNIGEDQGFHYLAMEYCEGETLDQKIKRDGAMPWAEALDVIMQAARGLQHAHEHGFVHRDIKPSNIMFCQPVGHGPRVAKILDLGLSKDLRGSEQSFATQTGVALGTPHYMSPEQARGDKDLDTRTDIYSLGATFYHLATGRTMFEGPTGAVIMLKHINEQMPDPHEVNGTIPSGVAQVIMKMLAKNPADRYASCKELLADLELVRAGKDPANRAVEGGQTGRLNAVRGGVRGRTTGPVSPVGTRQLAPVGLGKTGLRTAVAQEPPGGEAQAKAQPSGRGKLFAAAALVLIVLSAGVAVHIVNNQRAEKDALAAAEKQKADEAARLAEENRKAGEMRFNKEELRLKEEMKLVDQKHKSEEAKLEEEKRKLAEERRKLDEARLAAEADAKKKAESQVAKVEHPPAKPEVKPVQPGVKEAPSEALLAETKAAHARQLFGTALKEAAPLLAQNKLSDAAALLGRKAKDPALAEAAGLLKQEQADIESVIALRRSAVEALRKQVGQQITLKKGGTTFSGKVLPESQPDAVLLDMGSAQMPFNYLQLSVEDVDQYAPGTGAAGEDLRRRGIMFLAASNTTKAKEYFVKAGAGGDSHSAAYLDRITAIEIGDYEAAAVKLHELADRLWAQKSQSEALQAYRKLIGDYPKSKVCAQHAEEIEKRMFDALLALEGLKFDFLSAENIQRFKTTFPQFQKKQMEWDPENGQVVFKNLSTFCSMTFASANVKYGKKWQLRMKATLDIGAKDIDDQHNSVGAGLMVIFVKPGAKALDNSPRWDLTIGKTIWGFRFAGGVLNENQSWWSPAPPGPFVGVDAKFERFQKKPPYRQDGKYDIQINMGENHLKIVVNTITVADADLPADAVEWIANSPLALGFNSSYYPANFVPELKVSLSELIFLPSPAESAKH